MPVASRSAKGYLERSGIIPTIRGPLPVLERYANKISTLPLQEPLPLAEFEAVEQGFNPPDRGLTQEWPHGSS